MEQVTHRPISWDTKAAIYYLEQVQPYYRLLRTEFEYRQGLAALIVISVVAYHEILVGHWRNRSASGLAQVVRFCRRPPIALAAITPRVAHISSRLRAATGLATPDALIVATARAAGCTEIVGNDARWRGKPLGLPYRHLDDAAALH